MDHYIKPLDLRKNHHTSHIGTLKIVHCIDITDRALPEPVLYVVGLNMTLMMGHGLKSRSWTTNHFIGFMILE